VKNAFYKQTRRTWSKGEAGDGMANLVGHFEKHSAEVGAKNLDQYYNKANDLIERAEYSWKDGRGQVFFNPDNGFAAFKNSEGEISSFYKVEKPGKLEKFTKKVKELSE